MTASHKPHDGREITRSFQQVKVFGIEWPCPRWALGFGAVLLLVALAAFLARTAVLPAVADWQDRHDSYQKRVFEETTKHFTETPVVTRIGELATVRLYHSDGCLLVTRNSGGSTDQKWFFDLSRAKREPAPGRIASASTGALPWEGTAWADGRCPARHPGKFKQWEGERRKCWVQIFREWPDGCRQYQWYDSCYGVWDTAKDGTPKVYWEVCRH